MLLRSKQTSRNRTGSAVVELAFVLPVLMLMMLGTWEVGRMIEVTQILDNAAREGARQASAGTKTATDVDTIVKNYLTLAGINNAGCTVKVYNLTKNPNPLPTAPSDNPAAANQLDHLQVRVSLPFNNVKWIFVNQVITNVTTLTAKTEWFAMRDLPLTVDPTMPVN